MPEVRDVRLVKHQHISGWICQGAEGFVSASSLSKTACLLGSRSTLADLLELLFLRSALTSVSPAKTSWESSWHTRLKIYRTSSLEVHLGCDVWGLCSSLPSLQLLSLTAAWQHWQPCGTGWAGPTHHFPIPRKPAGCMYLGVKFLRPEGKLWIRGLMSLCPHIRGSWDSTQILF